MSTPQCSIRSSSTSSRMSASTNRAAASQSGSSPGSSATSSAERPSSIARASVAWAPSGSSSSLREGRACARARGRGRAASPPLRSRARRRGRGTAHRRSSRASCPPTTSQATGLPSELGRKGVPEPRRARSEASERPDVLAPVGIAKPQPVARGLSRAHTAPSMRSTSQGSVPRAGRRHPVALAPAARNHLCCSHRRLTGIVARMCPMSPIETTGSGFSSSTMSRRSSTLSRRLSATRATRC